MRLTDAQRKQFDRDGYLFFTGRAPFTNGHSRQKHC